MIIHVDIIVPGRVQGVGFRAGARHKAMQLNLVGWVQNWPDGTVHLSVEGNQTDITLFETWLKQGTFLARVDQVLVSRGKLERYPGFEIKRLAL